MDSGRPRKAAHEKRRGWIPGLHASALLGTLTDRPTSAPAAGEAVTGRLALAALRGAARAHWTLGNGAVAVDLPLDTGGAVLVLERAGAAAAAEVATDIDVGRVVA